MRRRRSTWLAARRRQADRNGLDTPSVDPADSKTLDSHHLLLRLNLRVLENLVLDAVPAGDYELIALPLKLAGACAFARQGGPYAHLYSKEDHEQTTRQACVAMDQGRIRCVQQGPVHAARGR